MTHHYYHYHLPPLLYPKIQHKDTLHHNLITPMHSPNIYNHHQTFYHSPRLAPLHTPPPPSSTTTTTTTFPHHSSEWIDMEHAARALLSFTNPTPFPSPPSPIPYHLIDRPSTPNHRSVSPDHTEISPLRVFIHPNTPPPKTTYSIKILNQIPCPPVLHPYPILNTYETQFVRQYDLSGGVHQQIVSLLVHASSTTSFDTLTHKLHQFPYTEIGFALDDLVNRPSVILRFLCKLQYAKVYQKLIKGFVNYNNSLDVVHLVVCGKFTLVKNRGFKLDEWFAIVHIPKNSNVKRFFPASAVLKRNAPALPSSSTPPPVSSSKYLAIPTSLLSCTTKGRRRFLRYKDGQVYVHGTEIPALATVSVTFPSYTEHNKAMYWHAVENAKWSGRPAEAIKELIYRGPMTRTSHRELMQYFDTTANLSTLTVAFMYAWARPLLPVHVVPWQQVPIPVQQALLAQVHVDRVCKLPHVHLEESFIHNSVGDGNDLLPTNVPENVHVCLSIGLECVGLENPAVNTSVPAVNDRQYYVREFYVLKIKPPE